mmetsp:Transcript_59793/g.177200  ORF Transcript_59793/g.177200 Transcript_59793/m.177200 type:complete len:204 (+) Transcript_59793:782-1393(+)
MTGLMRLRWTTRRTRSRRDMMTSLRRSLTRKRRSPRIGMTRMMVSGSPQCLTTRSTLVSGGRIGSPTLTTRVSGNTPSLTTPTTNMMIKCTPYARMGVPMLGLSCGRSRRVLFSMTLLSPIAWRRRKHSQRKLSSRRRRGRRKCMTIFRMRSERRRKRVCPRVVMMTWTWIWGMMMVLAMSSKAKRTGSNKSASCDTEVDLLG